MKFGVEIPNNPKTIQEKLIWLQFYDPMNYMKPICADKLKVREYAKEKLGKDICVPVLKVYDRPEDFNIKELPDRFVLKSNHAFKQVILCKDKNTLDRNATITTMKKWLSKPFGIYPCEPHYLYIQRKCFVEELLVEHSNSSSDLVDYKFLCFDGKPTYMQLIQDRHGPERRLQYYDMNKKYVELCRMDFESRPELKSKDILPTKFELMKEYAEKLSAPFKFVRVDFYEVAGEVYLGEMTFTPGAMLFKYKNPNTSIELGNMIKL